MFTTKACFTCPNNHFYSMSHPISVMWICITYSELSRNVHLRIWNVPFRGDLCHKQGDLIIRFSTWCFQASDYFTKVKHIQIDHEDSILETVTVISKVATCFVQCLLFVRVLSHKWRALLIASGSQPQLVLIESPVWKMQALGPWSM